MGIEPTSSAWKAEVLPLNYTRQASTPAINKTSLITCFPTIWWRGEDLNLRRLSRQIYSLIPLTTREPLQKCKPAIVLQELLSVNTNSEPRSTEPTIFHRHCLTYVVAVTRLSYSGGYDTMAANTLVLEGELYRSGDRDGKKTYLSRLTNKIRGSWPWKDDCIS